MGQTDTRQDLGAEPADPRKPRRFSRVQRAMRRHPVLAAAGFVLGLGLVVFVLVWFQPQKLFLDQRVSEAIPTAPAIPSPAATPTGDGQAPPSPADTSPRATRTLASGEFRSLEHETVGRALILELSDGRRFLRFEDLDTSNGPQLNVYLSELPPDLGQGDYGRRFIDLGPLKGNVGSQNYELPAGLDLSKYRSVVIWCVRFSVGFGVAGIEAET